MCKIGLTLVRSANICLCRSCLVSDCAIYDFNADHRVAYTSRNLDCETVHFRTVRGSAFGMQGQQEKEPDAERPTNKYLLK